MTKPKLVALACLVGVMVGGWSAAALGAEIHYGPQPNRTVNEKAVTYFVSVNGNDANDGRTRRTAFATLQKAADVVQPGQTVLVTKGVYHQGCHIRKVGRPDAWINFVAEPGAEICGSEVWRDWKPVAGLPGVYVMPAPKLFSNWQQPDTPLYNRMEQVFVNGKLQRQVPQQAMLKPRGTFYVDDATKQMFVCLEGGADPNHELTEVSTLTYAFAIGGPPNMNFWRDEQVGIKNQAAYIRLDGFRIRHIADFTRMAAIQVRGLCHDILIENCDVQWVNYCGIAISSLTMWDPGQNKWFTQETHDVTVRNCLVSNNGAQGIGGGGAANITLEYNVIDNNNYKGVSPWSEGGGIKTGFDGKHIVIRGNIVRNNANHGLWFDYGSTDCIIENNFVYNSIAGAVLDEVTPQPGSKLLPGGKRQELDLTAQQIRQLKQQGTIIRNNVLVGTRTPGGGGINISSSNDTRVYNNILYDNDGGGINLGGSPDRPYTAGEKGNRIYSNICDRNFYDATAVRPEDDKRGRTFDNVFSSNLFIGARGDTPFRIGGVGAGSKEWQALNQGAVNYYSDKSIFADPQHFNFTITDPALARKIGFDSTALRLDWSQYYVPRQQRQTVRRKLDYTPLDLSGVLNRALVDQVAGDGKGGWTDQGPNDMSRLPTGRQVIDGVQYQIGPPQKGALLLATDRVKPGGFPETVSIPVGRKFDELRFLYGAAWAAKGEIARFIVHYQDGGKVELPLVLGQQILDWWTDPTWQQQAALNDNGVYLAWQGPNREVARVSLYHLWWRNPNPGHEIASIEVTDRYSDHHAAFLLLAISGANAPRPGKDPRVFRLPFDGDVDAIGSAGDDIPAQGYNLAAFDAGKFTDGVSGKAFIPGKPLYYGVPGDFPLSGHGAITVWLKAEDWQSAARRALYKRADYTRIMTPFSANGDPQRYSVWSISFEVAKDRPESLTLSATVCGQTVKHEVGDLIKPEQWFSVGVRWLPAPDKAGHTKYELYLNGKLLASKEAAAKPDLIGNRIYIGVPSNGGQPWRGAMDDFEIWRQAPPSFPPPATK